MIHRLGAAWRRIGTRATMAFGVAVVLAVWTVAALAVADFSRAATPAGAAATTGAPRGGLVQDLAAPTAYSSPTTTPEPTTAAPTTTAPTTTAAVPTATTSRSSTLAGGHSTVTSSAAVAPPRRTATRSGTTTVPGPSGARQPGTSTPPPALVGPVLDAAAQSAARRYGWGAATKIDAFDDPGLGGWGRYSGPGHGGQGTRSPGAITAQGGVLTIAGDARGTTGGMAWGQGQKYGRWEVRMRAPVGDSSYHALALLWPDAENWPVGGEVDFAEISDGARRKVDGFLHYGAANSQAAASTTTDAAQWHNWAVEWTPGAITYFVDGVPWFQVTDPAKLPPGPLHLCLQLDWFPDGGAVTPTQMQVDSVAYYPITGSGASPAIAPGAAATVPPTTVPPATAPPTTAGPAPTMTTTPPVTTTPTVTSTPPVATTPPTPTTTPPVITSAPVTSTPPVTTGPPPVVTTTATPAPATPISTAVAPPPDTSASASTSSAPAVSAPASAAPASKTPAAATSPSSTADVTSAPTAG